MYLVRLAYCLLLIIHYRSPIDVLELISNIRNYHYKPHAVNVIIVIAYSAIKVRMYTIL